MAATKGNDEGKFIAQAYSEILNTDIKMRLCFDSKDLFTSLSTRRNSIDRSILSGVSCIRFEFHTGSVDKISWVPGNVCLEGPLTKNDSQITDLLHLSLFTGRFFVDIEKVSESNSSEKNFGRDGRNINMTNFQKIGVMHHIR